MTVISSASAMTWLLVTTRPDGSMMKPEPSEVARRGAASGCCPRGMLRSRKSLKNSSKGEPGGNCGISGRCRSAFSVCVVEMLTTAGNSFAARSENPSGPALAKAGTPPSSKATATSSEDKAKRCAIAQAPAASRANMRTAHEAYSISRGEAGLPQVYGKLRRKPTRFHYHELSMAGECASLRHASSDRAQ